MLRVVSPLTDRPDSGRLEVPDMWRSAVNAGIRSIGGHAPQIASDAWVAPTAAVIGQVTIGAGVGVFYSAVLRGDMEAISIGDGANLQDGVVVPTDPGSPARVGRDVSGGHGAVLHGCTVEDGALIGMNATVLNGAVVGEGSLVAAGALVLEGTQIPPRSLVAGVPAKVRRPLTDEEVARCRENARTYVELTARHAEAEQDAAGTR